jgi:hypothetical protein
MPPPSADYAQQCTVERYSQTDHKQRKQSTGASWDCMGGGTASAAVLTHCCPDVCLRYMCCCDKNATIADTWQPAMN